MTKHCLLFTLFIIHSFFTGSQASAQNAPIGMWRGHMPYTNAISMATDGVTLYVVSNESFFTYNSITQEQIAYSKASGMSDAMMSYVAYDQMTGIVVLAYNNSNIDLFKDGSFINIPDIKLKVINGDKNIYSIYTEDGLAYLSTGFGVVVLDLDSREIKETYSFITDGQTIPVKSFTAAGSYFYAATTNGLYRANKNQPNLQAFASWQKLDSRTRFNSLGRLNDRVFASAIDTLFEVKNDILESVYVPDTTADIIAITSANGGIWLNIAFPKLYYGSAMFMDGNYQISDSLYKTGQPHATMRTTNNTIWTADAFEGAYRRVDTVHPAYINPPGPSTYTSFEITANDGEVWVAHGMISDKYGYNFNRSGLSHFNRKYWGSVTQRYEEAMRNVDATDFTSILKDPANGIVYSTSFRSAMLVWDNVNPAVMIQNEFDPSIGDPGAYRVGQMAIDGNGNIWMPQSLAPHDMVMKNRNNQWFKFSGPAVTQYAFCIAIDDYDQKWYSAPGRGLIVMNDGTTPELAGDDKYRVLTTGDGLPGSEVYCLANDKDGVMWIGTDNGIAVVNCPADIISGGCKVELPIVQFDQFAGYLFQNEKVKTIAIDGGNRKWVGTTNGVWLLSPAGDQIIERFTSENSPLPSNTIQDIAIDPLTGDVYIGTELGLMSWRGTATDGSETNDNLSVFPNPVASGYNGPIAIRGLVENADVRITDISGQLVYRAKATGGQAVWNGMDYTGHRPQTGVYLIFVTNTDGTQTHTGKMIFAE